MALPGIAAALSDPLEAITKAFKSLAEVFQNQLASAVKDTASVFKEMGNALKTVAPILSTIGEKLKDFGKAVAGVFGGIAGKISEWLAPVGKALSGALGPTLGAFGKSLGSLAGLAGIAAGGVLGLGLAMGELVRKANPAVFDQFMLVVNDLMAVVGRALVPIFQTVFIPLLRLVADTLMQLAPIGQAISVALKPVVQVFGVILEIVGRALGKVGEIAMRLAPAFEAIGNVFVELVKAIQPVYDLLIDLIGEALVGAANLLAEGLKIVIPYITAFARVISDVTRFVANSIRELLALIGINLPDTPGLKPGSSVGAATRSAAHSSVDDVIKQAQRSSFSLGTASGGDPAKATAGYAKEIKDRTEEIYRTIKDLPNLMWEKFKGLANDIAAAFRALLPGGFSGGVKDVFSSGSSPTKTVVGMIPGGNLVVAGADFARRIVGPAERLIPDRPSWVPSWVP